MYNKQHGNIMRFDAEYFEHALDRIATARSGKRLWVYKGNILGERCYKVYFNDDDNVAIWIRSSVHGNLSAGTGEDSIRVWLVRHDDTPLSAKVSEYVTRRPGWESRLRETLTKLRQMRRKAGNCCMVPMSIYRSRKGKLFCRCNECNNFGEWLNLN